MFLMTFQVKKKYQKVIVNCDSHRFIYQKKKVLFTKKFSFLSFLLNSDDTF